MRVAVIGCGYLGAVHAASMCSLGHDVVGIDVDAAKIEQLSIGVPPFFEPAFDELLNKGLASGRLRFSVDFDEIANCEIHFLGVGTPQSSSGSADLSYLWMALDSLLDVIAAEASQPAVIVGKSTVPAGTARAMEARIAASGIPAELIWNPEFLREGFAVKDTLKPDRVVYGTSMGSSTAASRTLDECYAEILAAGVPRLIERFETAELVKVAANSFLATKISFINAMAELCEATGADVTRLAHAIGLDDRIGPKFLRAGIGFGGGCLPKDIRAFIARAEELEVPDVLAFLREVDAININRRGRMVELVEEILGQVCGLRLAVLGAAFKPNSDDIRDSPALDIADRLSKLGAEVVITDPQANDRVRETQPQLSVADDVSAAVRGADAVLLLTEWASFQELRPGDLDGIVGRKIMLDGRNCLSPDEWRSAGWTYRALGRP